MWSSWQKDTRCGQHIALSLPLTDFQSLLFVSEISKVCKVPMCAFA